MNTRDRESKTAMKRRATDGDRDESCCALTLYRREVMKATLLTAEEERELFKQLRTARTTAKRKEVRDKLIVSSLRAVLAIAAQYHRLNPNLPIATEDLIEEGNIGLIQAIDNFDLRYNVRFLTYAIYRIRRNMRVAIDRACSVNLTDRSHKIANQLRGVQDEEMGHSMKTVSVEDLAARTGISNWKRKIDWIAGFSVVHIDEHAGEQEDWGQENPAPLANVLCDHSWQHVEERIAEEEARALVHKAMTHVLTPREASIYSRHVYGEQSFVDMSKEHGLTRQRLNQICTRAQKKILTAIPQFKAERLPAAA